MRRKKNNRSGGNLGTRANGLDKNENIDKLNAVSECGFQRQEKSQILADQLNKKRKFGMQIEEASQVHSQSWFVKMWTLQRCKTHCAKKVHF